MNGYEQMGVAITDAIRAANDAVAALTKVVADHYDVVTIDESRVMLDAVTAWMHAQSRMGCILREHSEVRS